MPLFRSKKKAAAEAEAAAAAAAEGEGGKKKKLTRAQKEKLEKEVRRAPQRPQRFACACVPRTPVPKLTSLASGRGRCALICPSGRRYPEGASLRSPGRSR